MAQDTEKGTAAGKDRNVPTIDPGEVRPGEHVGRVPIRVRYAETDAQAIVYHSNYLIYFEVGRTDWVKATGTSYRDLEERGHALVIAESHLRFLASASYDDRLVIETRLVELRTRSCTFAYRVLRQDAENEVIVEGWTALVSIGPDRKVVPIPDDLAGAMRDLAAL